MYTCAKSSLSDGRDGADMLGFSMMVLDVEGVESLGFRVPGLKFYG